VSFSGRRGVHLWVCDNAAKELNKESRAAIIGFFRIKKVFFYNMLYFIF
jgi:DNA primase catalytic subunit